MAEISGSCLCGKVTFTCENDFDQFHLCHCLQCRKTTGSAHASNLFTRTDNIEWESGEGLVRRYDVPGRIISSAFCSECGSAVPYVSLSTNALVVPAGCLNNSPNISPQDNIFWSERASWYEGTVAAPKYDRFPDK